MTVYSPGHPDLTGEPDYEPCWCEHWIEDHEDYDCTLCTCTGYAEPMNTDEEEYNEW